ncbi:hypothetical protein Taro_045352 [Colocasia esculenta]|uniref:Uncharacterized protein n=1 Tax=Colocasia esculenta TaxID=4460 RepID=A0A843WLT0_COLES|nr:hypothetical protein [Colocasia esculenta]
MRRTFHDRRLVQSHAVAVQGRYLKLCSSSSSHLYLGVCPRLLYVFSVLWKYGYGEKRGSRRSDSVPVRAVWRLLDRGGVSSFVIRSFSKQKAYVGEGLEHLESAGRNCLTDEAGFFGLRFDTPVWCDLYPWSLFVEVKRQLDLSSKAARLRGEGEQDASCPSSSSDQL